MSKRRRNSVAKNFENIMDVKRSSWVSSSGSETKSVSNNPTEHPIDPNAKIRIPLSKADITLQQAMESFEKSEETDLYLQQLLKNNFHDGKAFRWSEQSGRGEEIEVHPVSEVQHDGNVDSIKDTKYSEDMQSSSAHDVFRWNEDALFSDQMLVLYLRLRHENQILRNQKQSGLLREYENILIETEHLRLLLKEYNCLERNAEEELKSKVEWIRKGIERSLNRQTTVLQLFEKKYPYLPEQLNSLATKSSQQLALFEAVLDESQTTQEEVPIQEVTSEPALDKEEAFLPPITMDNRLTLRGSSLHGRETDPVPGRPMVNNVPLLMVDESEYTDWHHYLYPQNQKQAGLAGSSHIIVKAIAGGNDADAASYMIEFARSGKRILIDAGMRLFLKGDRYPSFAGIPKPDLIIITRAHYQHAAALPFLVKKWPDIPIWASTETASLLPILLGTLTRTETEWTQDAAAYDSEEIHACKVRPIPWQEKFFPFHDDLGIQLLPAGQMPGASSVVMRSKQDSVFVSGDFALHSERISSPAKWIDQNFDIALLSITQGHYQKFARTDMEEILLDKIEEIVRKGGTALFPIGELGKESSLLALLKKGIADGSLSKVPFYVDGRIPTYLKAIESTMEVQQGLGQVALQSAHSLQWSSTEVHDANRSQIGEEAGVVLVNQSMLKEGSPGHRYFNRILLDPASAVFLPSVQDSFISLQVEIEQALRKNLSKKAEILYYHWPSFSAQDELLKGLEKINAQVVLLVHGNSDAHRNLRTSVPGHIVRRSIANQETIRVRPQNDSEKD
jgi:Cft2 family RNA processing exonuclease